MADLYRKHATFSASSATVALERAATTPSIVGPTSHSDSKKPKGNKINFVKIVNRATPDDVGSQTPALYFSLASSSVSGAAATTAAVTPVVGADDTFYLAAGKTVVVPVTNPAKYVSVKVIATAAGTAGSVMIEDVDKP